MEFNYSKIEGEEFPSVEKVYYGLFVAKIIQL